MSILNQFTLLAEYNQLMNQRQYDAAANLPHEILNKDMGAFFKSILGTLNHIMVGDIIWLTRFAQHPPSAESLSYILKFDKPESLDVILFSDFVKLSEERKAIDKTIINWIKSLSTENFKSRIEYKNMAGTSYSKPLDSLINHLFLHQTHHRGQVTTLLSQQGEDFGETDLIEIIT